MSEIIGYSVQWFTFRYEHLWNSEAVHFARAFLSHPDVLRNLAEDYRKSGRLIHIWRQIMSLHDDYVGRYPSWMPILQIRYWKAKPKDVGDLVVSDKRFDELKPIYLNAFELLGRMSTIALAVELIATTGATNVPTKKGSMAIWDFEQLDNGTKPTQLEKYAGTKHLVPLMKTELRNGIGHNAAHYDPVTDEVVCMKEVGATLKEWRMPYTGFCLATVELVSNVFFLEQYFFDLLGMSKDLFPSRKHRRRRSRRDRRSLLGASATFRPPSWSTTRSPERSPRRASRSLFGSIPACQESTAGTSSPAWPSKPPPRQARRWSAFL